MSKLGKDDNSYPIKSWVTPPILDEAKIFDDNQIPEQKKTPDILEPEPIEIISEPTPTVDTMPEPDDIVHPSDNDNTKNDILGGIDPKLLLGLLGNQTDGNPMMGTMLSMLGGDKPDMMTLLPLIMQMTSKKKEAPQKDDTANLDDFVVVQ